MIMNNYKIGVVKSLFNKEITDNLMDGINDYLQNNDYKKNILEVYDVPGAFEIPGTVKQLLNKNKYSCIVCIGSVIKGETAHFEFISNAVANKIISLNTESNIPIIFGVLTTYTYDQALSRSLINEKNKGGEIIDSAFKAMATYRQLNN